MTHDEFPGKLKTSIPRNQNHMLAGIKDDWQLLKIELLRQQENGNGIPEFKIYRASECNRRARNRAGQSQKSGRDRAYWRSSRNLIESRAV